MEKSILRVSRIFETWKIPNNFIVLQIHLNRSNGKYPIIKYVPLILIPIMVIAFIVDQISNLLAGQPQMVFFYYVPIK
jgi:hypothetical protein